MENGRAYVTLSSKLIEDFEYDEIQSIHDLFPGTIFFYLMCYTNNAVLCKLMERITLKEKIYVDDDKGNIFTFTEFKEYCLQSFVE